MSDQPAVPVRVTLTRRERRTVWLLGLVPVALVALLVSPTLLSGAAYEWAFAVVMFGGVSGVTAAVVGFDRLQARHCPRCGEGADSDEVSCPRCGYDLQARPRYACDERHQLFLEPGLCTCGRRLRQLEPVHGLGRQLSRMLWFGVWLLAVLVAVWFGLRLLG